MKTEIILILKIVLHHLEKSNDYEKIVRLIIICLVIKQMNL